MNNILVIEDNPADAELIKIYLNEASFKHKLFHSTSFAGGIHILSEHEIDLVLLDLSLDDSTGFSTLTKFVEEAPDTPVIVMTGLNNEIIGIQSVRAGAQDFLIKGEFNSHSLVRVIRYSLQRFKSRAQLKEKAEKLSIFNERFSVAQQMAGFSNWEMDVVNNSMKWSDEMFRIFGMQPGSISPSLSTYLGFVHLNDKKQVEAFFDDLLKSGKQKEIKHRILINGKTVKNILITAKVTFDELTNKIVLIGSAQDLSHLNIEEQLEEKKKALEIEISTAPQPFDLHNPFFSLIRNSGGEEQEHLPNEMKDSAYEFFIQAFKLYNAYLIKEEEVQLFESTFDSDEFFSTLNFLFLFETAIKPVLVNLQVIDTLPKTFTTDRSLLFQLIFSLIQSISFFWSEKRSEINLIVETEKIKAENQVLLRIKAQYEGKELQLKAPEFQNKSPEAVAAQVLRQFVPKLNGEIFTEKGGKGLQCFGFEFPIKTEAADSAKKQKGEIFQKLNVLLVESHVINKIAIKRMLSNFPENLNIETASNGIQAIKQTQKSAFDLILMNVQLPQLSGIEASKHIREFSNTPIIALTSKYLEDERETCLAAGINDYLSKPLNKEVLHSTIMNFFAL